MTGPTGRTDGHERYAELAAGHALHSLEPEDEQAFLAHVPGCARCERAVDEHRVALAALAYAPLDVEPPASLLEGIRAGVLASGREATFPDLAPSEPVAEPVPEPAAEPVSLDEARRRRDPRRLRRAATWTGVAAAAALVVSLGAWNASLQQDRDEAEAWGTKLAAAVGQLRDSSTDTVPLAGGSGEVVAVAVMRGDEMSLVVDGLPVNDAATTYVLWGQSRYGDKRAVGAFDVTADGVDVLDGMHLPDGATDVTALLVTREQGDAAPAIPTLPVLASGEV